MLKCASIVRVMVVPLLLMAKPVLAAAPTDDPAPCEVQYQVVDDWGNGFTTNVVITNNSGLDIDGWTLTWTFPGDQSITNLSNGAFVQDGASVAVSNASWNEDIGDGEQVDVSFEAQYSGENPVPDDFALNGQVCSLPGDSVYAQDTATPIPTELSPTATPTVLPIATAPPEPAGSPTVSTPEPPLSTPTPESVPAQVEAGNWPGRFFAPYADATGWPPFDFIQATRSGHVLYYTLGFIVAKSGKECTASWGTRYGMDDQWLKSEIEQVRQLGGNTLVSFGGSANTPLAVACIDVESLKREYRAVIEGYGFTHVDFDLEGAWITHPASVARRSQAVAELQAECRATGQELHVWYTLPVLPTGLTSSGITVLQSAIDYGVDIEGVNVLAMNYGDEQAPDPDHQMGEYAIQAAENLFNQLNTLYAAAGMVKSDQEVWKMVGVTPMIGLNDSTSETFYLEDAEQLLAFAQQHNIGMLAFWSINRDKACAGGDISWVDNDCSSIAQEPFDFSKVLNQFNQ